MRNRWEHHHATHPARGMNFMWKKSSGSYSRIKRFLRSRITRNSYSETVSGCFSLFWLWKKEQIHCIRDYEILDQNRRWATNRVQSPIHLRSKATCRMEKSDFAADRWCRTAGVLATRCMCSSLRLSCTDSTCVLQPFKKSTDREISLQLSFHYKLIIYQTSGNVFKWSGQKLRFFQVVGDRSSEFSSGP
jgi:hypothetical protein